MSALNHAKRLILSSRRQVRILRYCCCELKVFNTTTPATIRYFTNVAEVQSTIPSPSLEGQDKHYPDKIVRIVDEIAQLNLIEVSELNELLKIKLKIPDMPMMTSGVLSHAAPVAADEEELVREQTEFTVKLVKFDPTSKVKVIKAIKALIPDCNLVKAKAFVESVPQVLRKDVTKEEADEVAKTLTEAGGTATIE